MTLVTQGLNNRGQRNFGKKIINTYKILTNVNLH
jgi:hypothetical protein